MLRLADLDARAPVRGHLPEDALGQRRRGGPALRAGGQGALGEETRQDATTRRPRASALAEFAQEEQLDTRLEDEPLPASRARDVGQELGDVFMGASTSYFEQLPAC